MSDSRPLRSRKLSLTTVLVLVLVTAVSTAVLADHEFDDVPNSNQFHGSISWMADNEITVGCTEAGDEFCPDDNVRRETMSSFMRRFAQTFGAAGDQVTDTADTITVDSTGRVEVGSIAVTPKDEVTVALNAHVQVEVNTGDEARFIADIRRSDCDGTTVGSASVRSMDPVAFPHDTIAVTGFDIVDADTTYVLCVSKGAGTAGDGTVNRRGLIATWAPTA